MLDGGGEAGEREREEMIMMRDNREGHPGVSVSWTKGPTLGIISGLDPWAVSSSPTGSTPVFGSMPSMKPT